MEILLSNDDGFLAPGLNTLKSALAETNFVKRLVTIAPDRNRSAASNSLTLDYPLRLNQQGEDSYSVNGTPTDCVHLALTGFYKKEPDIVISGINAGANLGDDVLYSGTVAAAMEGRFLGFPSIAVSCASYQPKYFSTAAKAVIQLLKKIKNYPNQENLIFNINVPDLPWHKIQGYQVTRLGQRHKAKPVCKMKDPQGEAIYWVGPPGEEQDAGKGTDFYAIKQGFVSITPLHIDLTRHQSLETTQQWLES